MAEKVGDAYIEIRPDGKQFRTRLKALVESAANSVTATVDVEMSKRGLRTQLAAAVKEASAGVRANVDVDIDVGGMRRSVSAATKAAGAGQKIEVDVDVDTSSLTAVRALIRHLDPPTTSISKWGAIAAGILSVGSAAVQVTGALGPMLGTLAAAPGVFAAVTQGFGSIAFASAGVVSAFKTVTQYEQSLVTSAGSAARSAEQSADRRAKAAGTVADAQRSLQDAQADADRASVDGARKVEDARTAVSDASRDAARANADAARRIIDAEQALADAIDDEADAQMNVVRARRDARLAIEDLNMEVRQGALDEREAVLRLEQAQADLEAARTAGHAANSREMRETQLEYDQAAYRLDEIRHRNARNANEQRYFNIAGVEGAEAVKDARDAEADATQRVAEAAQGVRDAQAEASIVAQDGARAVVEAQRGVQDAILEASRSEMDAQQRVADAQRSLAEAQTAMADALVETGVAGESALLKMEDALARLSPSARRFVEYIQALKPRFEELGRAAQEQLFAGVDAGVRKLVDGTLPILEDGLIRTSGVFGNFARDAGDAFSSPAFKADLAAIVDTNVGFLDKMAGASIDLGLALFGITAEAGPLVDWLGRLAEKFGEVAVKQVEAWRESGQMADFFKRARETTEQFFSTLWDFAVGLHNVFTIAGEGGRTMLDSLEGAAAKFREWTETVEGKQQIREFFRDVNEMTSRLFTALDMVWRVVQEHVLPNLDKLAAAFLALKVINTGASVLSLASALAAIPTPALAVVGAVGLVAGAFVYAYQNSETFREVVNTAFQRVKDFIAGIVPQIQQIIEQFVELATLIWREYGDEITRLAEIAWDYITRMIQAALDIIQGLLKIFAGIFTGDWSLMWEGVLQVASGAWEALKASFRASQDFILTIWSGWITTLDNAWDRFWNTSILQKARDIGGATVAYFAEFGRNIAAQVQAAVNTAGALWDQIRGKFHSAIAWVIETPWNNGIVKAWNAVARLIDAPEIAPASVPSAPGGRPHAGAGHFVAATGGRVPGAPDHSGRDDVQARLTRGEWVMPVSSVQKYGPGFMRGVQLGRYSEGGEAGYAIGGLVEAGKQIQALFGARVSEHPSFGGVNGRHSKTSHHYSGNAIDVNTRSGASSEEKADLRRIAGWIRGNVSPITELFYPDNRDDHQDHLHLAMAGRGGGEASGGVFGLFRDQVAQLAQPLMDAAVRQIDGWVAGKSPVAQLIAGLGKKAATSALGWLFGRADAEDTKMMSVGVKEGPGASPGGGVERWRGAVLQALGIVGQPSSLANTTLRRMNQESGGRVDAVNRNDINWQRGYPSAGLMQVIRPTYQRYRHPAHDRAPFMYGVSIDPMSNILASMRYALDRYGSLSSAYNRSGGYRAGGPVELAHGGVFNDPFTGLVSFAERAGSRPEIVTPEPLMADTFRKVLGQMGGAGGSTVIKVDARRDPDAVPIARAIAWKMKTVGV